VKKKKINLKEMLMLMRYTAGRFFNLATAWPKAFMTMSKFQGLMFSVAIYVFILLFTCVKLYDFPYMDINTNTDRRELF